MRNLTGQARKGDVIRFKGHALRVETEPFKQGRRVRLEGRENRGSRPYVTRWYFDNVPCDIERADDSASSLRASESAWREGRQ